MYTFKKTSDTSCEIYLKNSEKKLGEVSVFVQNGNLVISDFRQDDVMWLPVMDAVNFLGY